MLSDSTVESIYFILMNIIQKYKYKNKLTIIERVHVRPVLEEGEEHAAEGDVHLQSCIWGRVSDREIVYLFKIWASFLLKRWLCNGLKLF